MNRLVVLFLLFSGCRMGFDPTPENEREVQTEPFYTINYGVYVSPSSKYKTCSYEIEYTIDGIIEEMNKKDPTFFKRRDLKNILLDKPLKIFLLEEERFFCGCPYVFSDGSITWDCWGKYFIEIESLVISSYDKKLYEEIDGVTNSSLPHELIHYFLWHMTGDPDGGHVNEDYWLLSTGKEPVEALFSKFVKNGLCER